MNPRAMCELCNRHEGPYSQTRGMYVCLSCWDAMGAQEKRFDAAVAGDLTGQDAEARS